MGHAANPPVVSLKRQPPRYRFATNCYDHFQVIAIHAGRLSLRHGTEDARWLNEGQVLVLRPGAGFELTTGTMGYSGVCFNQMPLPDDADDPMACPGPPVAFEAQGELRALSRRLEHEARSPGRYGGELLLHLGWCFALTALRQAETDRPTADPVERHWAERVKAALDSSVYQAVSAREALADLGLSYRQLSRYFVGLTGLTPKAYQIKRRIHEAKRLLATTRLSITTIAFELGYPSSQHFAQQFRQLTGKSPSQFPRPLIHA